MWSSFENRKITLTNSFFYNLNALVQHSYFSTVQSTTHVVIKALFFRRGVSDLITFYFPTAFGITHSYSSNM